jgi:hypothetical protein
LRKRPIIVLIAIIASILLILGGSSMRDRSVKAQSASDDRRSISPEAMKQIDALTKEKESRTDTEKKIDSRLLFKLKMARGQDIAEGVRTLDTGVLVDDKGFVEVDISAYVNKRLTAFLRQINAEIIASFPEYRSITARVPIAMIERLAAREDVIFVQPKADVMFNQSRRQVGNLLFDSSEAASFQRPGNVSFATRSARVRQFLTKTLSVDDLTGTTTSQADTTHRAALARTLTGFTGAGIKIGILSNGVNSLAARQASGDLPAGVTVLAGQAGSGDEGTAMLELVYDLAPGAQLFYATALGGNAQFATNIKALRTAGCDIIIDDVSYFNESPFQNGQAPSVVSPGNGGIIAQAVNDVTIGSQAGALYFSSAANSGNKNDNTSGAWEGDFADGGATGAPIPVGNRVHDFGGGVIQNVLLVDGRVLLKWSDPLGASSNDYDLYILNSAGTTVVASSANVQSGTQDPVEDAGNCFAGERIVIVKKTAASARFLHLNTNRGRLTVSTPGVIYGHNGGVNTISVAATPAGPAQNNAAIGPFPFAHSAADVVETFSSDGPRRIFYNADGTLITPGDVSSTGGQLLQKPDITAADGTTTTTPGFIPFFGTSAAAPHAGALMALLKQASPAATSTQLYNAMINSAIDIEAPGVDRDSGYGIFMPLRAMSALSVAGPAFLDLGTPTTTEGFGNGNGRVDPGESGGLTLPLNNLGLTNATVVSAVLTTSTPGVTIFDPTLPYPNIAAAVGTGLTANQFRFGLANNFPCGAPISFVLTVTYAGGSAPSQVFNFTVKTDAQVVINSTLDTTPPAANPLYTAVTGTQTGRLNRNGVISSCASPKATPGLQDSTVGRRYDAYTLTASASGCTTITLSTTANNAANNIYLAVYNSSGYVPTAITSNYLADWGVTTSGLVTVGFNATAGQQYTIVVHEITVGGGTGVAYTLNIGGPITGACQLAPTAAAASVSGRVTLQDGAAVRNASVTLTDLNGQVFTARTNTFGFYTVTGLASGTSYVAAVTAKGASFEPRQVTILDNITGFDFVAEP